MSVNPLEWISKGLVTLTVVPVLAMMIQVTLDVILKYTINSPIQGTLEITSYYYMVAIVVLPMAFVEMTRQSIAVELFYQMLPRRIQIVAVGFVLLLCIAGYAGLAWISIPDAFNSFRTKEVVMGVVNIQIWPSRFILPISLLLTAAVSLMLFIRLFTTPLVRDFLVDIPEIDPDTEAN